MINYLSFLWKPVLEILILWFVFYRLILFFEGTRAIFVLRGITVLVIAFFVFQRLGLDTLDWILTKLFAISVIGVLIIFQPELRQGLARLGQRQPFRFIPQEEEIKEMIEETAEAAQILSQKRIGVLIALEREIGFRTFVESGIMLDSKISSELIQSIFMPTSLLHDGGMVIRGDRIIAASCLFPLTENPIFKPTMGMRHRAAIGLSEETDAAIVVVSEETGEISLAASGRLNRGLAKADLVLSLKGLFKRKKRW